MDRNKLFLIGGGVLLLIALGVGGFLLFNKKAPEPVVIEQVDNTRKNTLILAQDYLDQGEFQRALDLLDSLLIQDATDSEAKALRDRIIDARKVALDSEKAEERQNQEELVDSLEDLGNSISEQTVQQVDPAELERQRQAEELRRQQEALRRQEEMAALQAQIAAAEERRIAEEERLAALSQAEREKAREVLELINEGVEYLESLNYAQAISTFDQALDLDSSAAPAYAYKGESYFQQDSSSQINIQEAVKNANKAIQNDQNLWVPHNTLGKIYSQTKNWDNAVTEFREASRLNPENSDVLYNLGKAQYRSRNFNDARQSFEGCVHLDSTHSRAYYNLGATYIQLGNLGSALDSYTKSAEADPDFSAAYFSIGEVLKRQGKYVEADSAYKQAATLAPENFNYTLALATNLFRLGRYGEAETGFRKAVAINPDKPEASYNMALTLNIQGKPEEALEYAVKAVQLKSNSASYLYTMGEISEALDMIDGAIAAYEKSASIDLSYTLPRINLGNIYDQREIYDKALEHLLAAYRVDPEAMKVNNNLGNVYLHTGLYENAITHYEKALARNPDDTLMRYHLAIAYIETEQDASAKATLNELITIAPNYYAAYDRLGNLLYKEGDRQAASDIFKMLLQKNPDYPARASIEPLILP